MKFRSVIKYVDAVQFLPAKMSWPEGVTYVEKDLCGIPLKEGIYFFDNEDAICEIKPGDWIITDEDGHRWRWNTKIMKLNFTPVDDCPAWDLSEDKLMFNEPKTKNSTEKSFTFNCGCIITIPKKLDYCHWAYCAIHLYAQEALDANRLAKTALLNALSNTRENDETLTALTAVEESITHIENKRYTQSLNTEKQRS